MATIFKPRVRYSFDTYAAPILGTGFKNITVQAVLDYDSAMSFADIEATHRSVYSFLPEGTPDRPQDFDYLLLKTADNIVTVIGVPWIVEDSVTVVQNLKASVVIEDLNGSDDIERIRACLSQNGFNKIAISLISG